MTVRSLLTLLLAIPLAFALAACGDDDDGASGDDATGATTPAEATDPAGGDSEAIDISAQDFVFSPASISAVAGEEVTVAIANTGNAAHTFTIDALGVDIVLNPGEDGTVSFTPTGNDTFYCRFHRSLGMEGTLSTDGTSAADPGGGNLSPTAAANEFSY